MREGAVVALVSDAGMPLVSDPGYVLVRACVAAGLPVEVLPGPSAAITALVASGLPADRVALPRLPAAQEGRAARGALASRAGTLVAFESPRRLPATLALLAELDPEREVAVCRELTKAHEEVVRGTAAELAARYAGDAAEGRGGAGARPRSRRRPRTRRTARGSTRCAGWWRRARSRGRPPAWWRS